MLVDPKWDVANWTWKTYWCFLWWIPQRVLMFAFEFCVFMQGMPFWNWEERDEP